MRVVEELQNFRYANLLFSFFVQNSPEEATDLARIGSTFS
jgi:hypothetical protein